ncbi:MAG: P-type conjugative transfer protein TrbL [Methylococcales bacterium]
MTTLAHLVRVALLPLSLGLMLFSVNAQAAIDNAGILDNALNSYSTAANSWASTITAHASWLFWTLALISMVWTFGLMALRKADIGEFFAEFIRFTMFTGFFWWLLVNGPNFATSIMTSLRTIGGNATGTGSLLTPSSIVDIGFDIFFKVLDQSSVWSPVDSAVGIIMGAIVLVILALIGVNMLLLLVSGWVLAYAGIFFLGFGGSRWTSEMAIIYFKTVLGVAAQLFTMVLLVGIGKSFIDQYYTHMSAGLSLKELGVMMIVSVVLLALVNKVPPLIGSLAGGSTGSLGNGFGAGTAMGAAAMGAAAAATAGAAMAAGATNMAGGAQAIMTAFSKASALESADSGTGDMMAAMRGDSDNNSGSGSALASAMDGSSMGKVAANTVANLAQGTWDVAKAKASDMRDAAMDRVSETTGGKIAAAIEARDAAPGSGSSQSSSFSNNSLSSGSTSTGSNQFQDAASEVASFRDRDLKAS